MSKRVEVPFSTTLLVRDTCLCLHVQRAARALARRFDEALRPLALTHGQFSLLNALNRDAPAQIPAVSSLLGMDRTTLTAALKPLERRRLVIVTMDPDDGRSRRVALSASGKRLLASAVPVWRRTHEQLEAGLPPGAPKRLRSGLDTLAAL